MGLASISPVGFVRNRAHDAMERLNHPTMRTEQVARLELVKTEEKIGELASRYGGPSEPAYPEVQVFRFPDQAAILSQFFEP